MDSFEYFSQLEYIDKFHILWEEGLFLSNYQGEKHSVNLFALDHFYVEVYYNNFKDEILYINTFENTDLLDKYLVKISIQELMFQD